MREIAKELPSPKSDTDDPLGGIRALNAQTPGERKEDVLHAVGRSVEKCLEESIQSLSRTEELPTEEQTEGGDPEACSLSIHIELHEGGRAEEAKHGHFSGVWRSGDVREKRRQEDRVRSALHSLLWGSPVPRAEDGEDGARVQLERTLARVSLANDVKASVIDTSEQSAELSALHSKALDYAGSFFSRLNARGVSLEDLFSGLDADHSNSISSDKLNTFFCAADPTGEIAQSFDSNHLLQVFDANGDGTLDREEFANFCAQSSDQRCVARWLEKNVGISALLSGRLLPISAPAAMQADPLVVRVAPLDQDAVLARLRGLESELARLILKRAQEHVAQQHQGSGDAAAPACKSLAKFSIGSGELTPASVGEGHSIWQQYMRLCAGGAAFGDLTLAHSLKSTLYRAFIQCMY